MVVSPIMMPTGFVSFVGGGVVLETVVSALALLSLLFPQFANKVEMVSQHPQHWCSRVYVYLLCFSVDIQVKYCHNGKNYNESFLKFIIPL
jgi:hypothetical protein